MDPIEGIIMFAAAAVTIYILFPILAGVQSATNTILPVSTNTSTQGASALYNVSQTAGTAIASSASLMSLETLLISAIIIISTVMLIRRHKA